MEAVSGGMIRTGRVFKVNSLRRDGEINIFDEC